MLWLACGVRSIAFTFCTNIEQTKLWETFVYLSISCYGALVCDGCYLLVPGQISVFKKTATPHT